EIPAEYGVPRVDEMSFQDHLFQGVQCRRLCRPTLADFDDRQAIFHEWTHDRLRQRLVKADLPNVEPIAQVANAGLDSAIVDHVAGRRGNEPLLCPSHVWRVITIAARSKIVTGAEEMRQDQ